MHRLVLALIPVAMLAGCTGAQQGAAFGAASGAAIGVAAGGGSNTRNAIIGGATGALIGTVVGASRDHPGYCLYRDRNGHVFRALCKR